MADGGLRLGAAADRRERPATSANWRESGLQRWAHYLRARVAGLLHPAENGGRRVFR